jgi:tetratricopeptide (TPR) repeat protein
MPSKTQSRCTIAGIIIVLLAIVWVVFAQIRHYDFVNFDDDLYVYNNTIVKHGLTLPGAKWAFTDSHARNWHPLTTISHMIDCQLYGLNAGRHHLTNVGLHSAGVVLLFLVLLQITNAIWRSALVAALFAIHPQHVESVAWIAERKDVLSGVFFMLTLIAYVHYARRPSVMRYVAMSILFICGLISKIMLVTLPFILLLLDYWPLGRFAQPMSKESKAPSQHWWDRQSPARRLFIEKTPLLAFSAAAGVVTFLIQVYAGTLSDPLPLPWRIGNALVSYITYIWQMIWPAGLAALYPHPENQLPFWKVTFALVALLAVTAVAILRRRKNPYLFVGWFWYLVMLIPVIGIIQVGAQGWADRYTYLPHIGLYIAVIWLGADLISRVPYRRPIAIAIAVLVLGAYISIARLQASYWKGSESLWTRALDVTAGNHLAHNNLGTVFNDRGQLDQALQHYEAALESRARYRTFRHDFWLALYHANIASVLRQKGKLDEAIMHCREALELQPNYGIALSNLADALSAKGQIDDAIALYRKALEIYRGDPETETNLAMALLKKGMDEEAIQHLEAALRFDPRFLTALNNLAWLHATSGNPSIRNGTKAVMLAEQAVRLSGGKNPLYLHKLAAAYAEAGDFSKALAVGDSALKLATEEGNSALARELQRNIDIYRTNSPLRDARRPR